MVKIKLTYRIVFLWFVFNTCYGFGQSFPRPQDDPKWIMDDILSLAFVLEREDILIDSTPIILEEETWNPVIRIQYWNPESPLAPPDAEVPDTVLVGYYRQSTEQVFFRNISPEGSSSVRADIIYDFSLEEGDSLYAYGPVNIPSLFEPVLYRVLETGTIDCSGQVRKWLDVEFLYTPYGPFGLYYRTYWVEGIGDIHHPFIPTICFDESTCEVRYINQKFVLGRDTIEINASDMSCIMTDVFEIGSSNTIRPRLNVYPDPMSASYRTVSLGFENCFDKQFDIKLFKSTGQLIYETRLDRTCQFLLPPLIKKGNYWLSVKEINGLSYYPELLILTE